MNREVGGNGQGPAVNAGATAGSAFIVPASASSVASARFPRYSVQVMRLVVQRVASAAVCVGDETVGGIEAGMLVLAGVEVGDGEAEIDAAARKLKGLRLFDDERGRMNLDVRQFGGAVLLVSQFTLAASTRKGLRPSFSRAAAPERAAPLFDRLRQRLEDAGLEVSVGRFGARMRVELVNDGPVTFVLDFSSLRP